MIVSSGTLPKTFISVVQLKVREQARPVRKRGDDREQPVMQMRITWGSWLGQHEVTQDQWQGVMGTNLSRFSGCGRCPVVGHQC